MATNVYMQILTCPTALETKTDSSIFGEQTQNYAILSKGYENNKTRLY